MSKIEKYKKFCESSNGDKLWIAVQHEISIYDWFERLKSYQYSNNSISLNSLKTWTNHFIGDGYYEKIISHVDKVFNSLKKVNIDYVSDRMIDIFDNYSSDKNTCIRCVLYGDYDKLDLPDCEKYNGSIMISDVESESQKINLIVNILRGVIYPTLFIGYPSVNFRMGRDESYVTDKKYQCSNFDINQYSMMGYIKNNKLMSNNSRVNDSDLSKKEKYNIDNIIEMYRPGIYIKIDDSKSMNLLKIEKEIDDTLESILPELDYKEVIFDMSRFDRKFNTDKPIHGGYTLKILLNL